MQRRNSSDQSPFYSPARRTMLWHCARTDLDRPLGYRRPVRIQFMVIHHLMRHYGRFWRSVLFQMILFGALSFVGPAMGDAISNLGGGGLSTPYLANLANALNYACGCLVTLVGGPLINKLGIKLACLVAAVTMPLNPSAYYASARHGAAADAYLLASSLIGGLSGGFLYVAETSAMLSYPQPEDRGLYLGIWSAMRNTGSMLGGAVNFATSYTRDGAGGIPWSTYLVFVGFACTGVVWALLLSPSGRVRRRDGCPVPVAEGSAGWACEFAALWAQIRRRETWLVFLPAFYSFFYGGTMGTYLSLHFSVRARALSSLLVPSVVIPLVLGFGRLLDQTRWSQRTRAWIGFLAWVVPQAACFLWIGREYSKFGTSKLALDYGHDSRAWAEAYLPYLIIFSTGYWTQLSLYWILGTFCTDVQSSSRTGGPHRCV
ncbi:hypothetical protein P8C59_009155 [Phyllachora maydis]|uniref:UNC93-like protein 2 n=1 Tax=Phyllachora maydis TaxID=1825666 RepID=A0AAD9IDH4_9PEZI|nr:hypothetical protein P8C59_009155 [Phyllachora maydis]